MKLFNKITNNALIAVLLGIILYVVLLSGASILRYKVFRASAFDMAIEIQNIWNTSHGRLLEDSINLGFIIPRFWVAHWEFIFIPLAGLFRLFPSPLTILIVQTIVLASGAIPIYWLAKDKLKNHFAAVCFAYAYLLYPAMQNANLADVHGLTFVTPMLLFAFYFLQKRNLKLFSLFAFLSLLCREDASLILFMFGLYSIFVLKEKKLGVAVSGISIFWFLVFLKRTAIRSMIGLPPIPVPQGITGHWDHLKAVFDNPFYIVDHLAKKYNIRYFINLFAPVGFLSLLSPLTLILAAPTFSINLLSDWVYAHDIQHQYTSTITPIIFISTIYGLKNVSSLIEKKFSVQTNKVRLLKTIIHYCVPIGVVALSVTFCVFKSNVFKVYSLKVTEHHKTIDKVISLIPTEASLCAETHLAPHAAMRRELYVFPQHMNKVDFVLYDFNARQVRLWTKPGFGLQPSFPVNSYIRQLLSDRDYGILHYEDGVILFKRGFDYDEGLRKLAIAQKAEIPHFLHKSINDEISCIGYDNHEGSIMWSYSPKTGVVIRKMIHFTIYWEGSLKEARDIDFVFNIRNAQHSYFFSKSPVFGLYPTSKWREGEIIRDEIFWEVPQDIQTGRFSVFVSAKDKNKKTVSVYLFEVK